MKEFEWFERFEWFGPSPIEPFNSGPRRRQHAWLPQARIAPLRRGCATMRLLTNARTHVCKHFAFVSVLFRYARFPGYVSKYLTQLINYANHIFFLSFFEDHRREGRLRHRRTSEKKIIAPSVHFRKMKITSNYICGKIWCYL